MTTPDPKVARIRELMPVTQNKTYLNTGTAGPLSKTVLTALHGGAERNFNEGRANLNGFITLMENLQAARQHIATLTKSTPADIAITHHTTEGMNIVLHGFNWQAGDEVITTTLEHEGGLLPLYVLRQRFGVVVKMIDITPDDDDAAILAKFEAAMTPRTRLQLFSHVSWNLGTRLPMTELVALGHQHQVLSLVDAAQSIGAIELDLPASGVDFYAMPGQKWLCGPEGTGALYVRPDRLSQLNMTFTGFFSMKDFESWDFTGHFMPAPGAKRFEVGTVYRPGIEAMSANLAWLAEDVGWTWIFERIEHLHHHARQALSQLEGVSFITPPGPNAGLLSFSLADYDPARVMLKLLEDDIVTRFLGHPYCLRVSTGFYNTEADIDRLVDALKHVQTLDPDSLPTLEW